LFLDFMRYFREPANNPKSFLKRGRKSRTEKLIVCAGDSITHGIVSANYVEMLREQFKDNDYEFVNAGINGNLAWNVLQRLDDIIACQPDVVTLLVGTNDVNMTFNEEWEDMYRKQQKITEKPSLAGYCRHVESIIEQLQSETDAQLAILSLPMLGEDLDSEMNQKITDYNAALQVIAEEKGIQCLPLHQNLVALISQDHLPPAYNGKLDLMMRAIFQHYVLRKSWDAISRDNQLDVLTDHIHINDKAAGVIAKLIGDILASY
jgi:lysophospholipase L1-like esterase